jgi:hypothetical protein
MFTLDASDDNSIDLISLWERFRKDDIIFSVLFIIKPPIITIIITEVSFALCHLVGIVGPHYLK